MAPLPSTPELDELTITIIVDNATDTSRASPRHPAAPRHGIPVLGGIASTAPCGTRPPRGVSCTDGPDTWPDRFGALSEGGLHVEGRRPGEVLRRLHGMGRWAGLDQMVGRLGLEPSTLGLKVETRLSIGSQPVPISPAHTLCLW